MVCSTKSVPVGMKPTGLLKGLKNCSNHRVRKRIALASTRSLITAIPLANSLSAPFAAQFLVHLTHLRSSLIKRHA